MVKEHLTFKAPENEEIKVWRYMDFTKLISLIDTSSLFFTRADQFNDPFEMRPRFAAITPNEVRKMSASVVEDELIKAITREFL